MDLGCRRPGWLIHSINRHCLDNNTMTTEPRFFWFSCYYELDVPFTGHCLSLWASFSSSENKKVEPCHVSDPSLQAVASRSLWDLWLRKGVPAQQPPTLPAQCTNQQNTWLAPPRAPALPCPNPTQHVWLLFLFDVLGTYDVWEILG